MAIREAVTGFFSPTPKADPKVQAATAALADAQAKHLASVGDLETLRKAAEIEADRAFASGDRTAYRAAMALVAEQEGIVRAAQRAVEVAERALADALDAKAAADRAKATDIKRSAVRSTGKKIDAMARLAENMTAALGRVVELGQSMQQASDSIATAFPGAAPLLGRRQILEMIHEEFDRVDVRDDRFYQLPFSQPPGSLGPETVSLADRIRRRKPSTLELHEAHLGLREIAIPEPVTAAPAGTLPVALSPTGAAASPETLPAPVAMSAPDRQTSHAERDGVPLASSIEHLTLELSDDEIAAALATVNPSETAPIMEAQLA